MQLRRSRRAAPAAFVLGICLSHGCGGSDPEPVGAADAATSAGADAASLDAAPPVADAAPDAAVDAATSTYCLTEDRDDDYAPGMSKVGEAGYTVVLVSSDPGPPDKGNNAWVVQALDPEGAAVDDLDIDVFSFMPDHGHGTPVTPVITPQGGDGQYAIDPINLYMTGLWTVRLALEDADANELDRVVFAFCVDG